MCQRLTRPLCHCWIPWIRRCLEFIGHYKPLKLITQASWLIRTRRQVHCSGLGLCFSRWHSRSPRLAAGTGRHRGIHSWTRRRLTHFLIVWAAKNNSSVFWREEFSRLLETDWEDRPLQARLHTVALPAGTLLIVWWLSSVSHQVSRTDHVNPSKPMNQGVKASFTTLLILMLSQALGGAWSCQDDDPPHPQPCHFTRTAQLVQMWEIWFHLIVAKQCQMFMLPLECEVTSNSSELF